MNKDFHIRLKGMRYLIHSIHHNIKLLEYISYDMHNAVFNIANNSGIKMLWNILIEHQLIYFYKLLSKNEKFSFLKFLKIAQNKGVNLDLEKLELLLNECLDLYIEYEFEMLRSKYIAHMDLNVNETKTELTQLSSLTHLLIELFNDFQTDLGFITEDFSLKPLEDFAVIFKEVEEYARVKGYIAATEIKGKDSICIEELAKEVKSKII